MPVAGVECCGRCTTGCEWRRRWCWSPWRRAAAAGRHAVRVSSDPHVNVVDDYHGTKAPDPYRWLEDLSSPEVREWAVAQRNVAVPLMRANDLRPWLARRIEALGRAWDAYDAVTTATSPALIDRASLGSRVRLLGTWPSPDRPLCGLHALDGWQ
ncbi:MAG: hypothetical protein ABIX28_13170 [Vicinamibacterales bacterium]